MDNPERQVIEVEVYEHDGHHPSSERVPGTLAKAIDWLQSKLDFVPPEYRGVVRLEIDATTWYEMEYPTIKIVYSRPETDEEMSERRENFERNREAYRRRDLAQLRELQAKYPEDC